ncbi:MAG TPA: hypothetical protein DF712_20765 [Balneola sp.]|nr:hypothetical protein [Balneola sp.]
MTWKAFGTDVQLRYDSSVNCGGTTDTLLGGVRSLTFGGGATAEINATTYGASEGSLQEYFPSKTYDGGTVEITCFFQTGSTDPTTLLRTDILAGNYRTFQIIINADTDGDGADDLEAAQTIDFCAFPKSISITPDIEGLVEATISLKVTNS